MTGVIFQTSPCRCGSCRIQRNGRTFLVAYASMRLFVQPGSPPIACAVSSGNASVRASRSSLLVVLPYFFSFSIWWLLNVFVLLRIWLGVITLYPLTYFLALTYYPSLTGVWMDLYKAPCSTSHSWLIIVFIIDWEWEVTLLQSAEIYSTITSLYMRKCACPVSGTVIVCIA
jgi:hypothetical protein